MAERLDCVRDLRRQRLVSRAREMHSIWVAVWPGASVTPRMSSAIPSLAVTNSANIPTYTRIRALSSAVSKGSVAWASPGGTSETQRPPRSSSRDRFWRKISGELSKAGWSSLLPIETTTASQSESTRSPIWCRRDPDHAPPTARHSAEPAQRRRHQARELVVQPGEVASPTSRTAMRPSCRGAPPKQPEVYQARPPAVVATCDAYAAKCRSLKPDFRMVTRQAA